MLACFMAAIVLTLKVCVRSGVFLDGFCVIT